MPGLSDVKPPESETVAGQRRVQGELPDVNSPQRRQQLNRIYTSSELGGASQLARFGHHSLQQSHHLFSTHQIVPMINPDGVFHGNYRSNTLGYDCNRHWAEPNPDSHAEVHSLRQLLTAWHNDPDVDLDFYVDLHAHSAATDSFMYCNSFASLTSPEPEQRRPKPPPVPVHERLFSQSQNQGGAGTAGARGAGGEEEEDDEETTNGAWLAESRFPRLLAARSACFSFERTRFMDDTSDPSKEGTGRRALGTLLGRVVHWCVLGA